MAITAAPTRIRDVAKALLNLVPMTFSIVGNDPKLAIIVESSDFHYAITDHIKVVYRIDLTINRNVEDVNHSSLPPSVTFQFQYMRPNFEKLREAVIELCRYVTSKGASLEVVSPPEPGDPETKPFDQEKSNSYGQGSVTQPYHSPAQIAAAAQGSFHPSFHMNVQYNSNFHQGGPNNMYHPNSNIAQHGHLNGLHGHTHLQQHFGRGYQQISPTAFNGPRPPMSGNRHGHSPSPHHGNLYQNGYPSFTPHVAGRNGGGGNHFGYYNTHYIQGGGGSSNINASNGYQRRFIHNSPNTSDPQSPGSASMNFQQIPRTGGMAPPSSLDTLSSIELPDVSGSGNGSGGGYRSHQEVHTPTSNGGTYSPSTQSYFPPQPNNIHQKEYPHNQGYRGGHSGSRYQS